MLKIRLTAASLPQVCKRRRVHEHSAAGVDESRHALVWLALIPSLAVALYFLMVQPYAALWPERAPPSSATE